ncbi:MAG: HEPN domain-containing protein [Synergistaceae bacterium]|nr:HEPN domain-containing protein [Synergistaceae bacterium]
MKNPEALDWYRFAKRDLQSAKTLNEHSQPRPLEIICYLSEQCVEKMLKGFLIANSQNPPRTHDLPMLCDMCIKIDKRFDELSDISEFLTLYGVQPRYPNEIEIIDEDVNRALKYIHDVMNFFERCELMIQESDCERPSDE